MDRTLHLLFTQGWLVLSLVEIGPVVLEKKMKMWKVYDNNKDDDNNEKENEDGQRKIFDQKSSGDLITHTYIEWGHSQMKGNSVHAIIEGPIKNSDMFSTSDWMVGVRNAQVNPSKYVMRELENKMFWI